MVTYTGTIKYYYHLILKIQLWKSLYLPPHVNTAHPVAIVSGQLSLCVYNQYPTSFLHRTSKL